MHILPASMPEARTTLGALLIMSAAANQMYELHEPTVVVPPAAAAVPSHPLVWLECRLPGWQTHHLQPMVSRRPAQAGRSFKQHVFRLQFHLGMKQSRTVSSPKAAHLSLT
jgi:hypothetical protein